MINQRDIEFIINAHQNNSKKEKYKTRIWDKKTPYSIHPIWCATMLLHETSIEEKIRKNGSTALLYHDILEDTNSELPEWLDEEIIKLIESMTFKSSEESKKLIWERDPITRMLKLYDKTSNLLDGVWREEKYMKIYKDHVRKLILDVEKNFGDLNITKFAKTLVK